RASRVAVFRTWTPVSIRSSTLALVVESADFLGVLLLVRAAILSEATRIARFARSRRSDLISSPRLGASSSPATTPKPSPAKKVFIATSSRSFRQLAAICRVESACQPALATYEPEPPRQSLKHCRHD